MMPKNVLFIDTVHPLLKEELQQNGFNCIDASLWDREKVLDGIATACGIVIRSRFLIDREFLEHRNELKFIARAGSGIENIDTGFAKSVGIACLNAPEANKDAVAEQAIGMLLMLLNKLAIADKEVRKGSWKRGENRGTEINGLTVAIIGFGNNGSAFAEKMSGFRTTILAYDPLIKISEQHYPFVQQVTMDEIFQQADIISFHVPLNDTTHYMVNESYLNAFSKNIWLINTARGKILETAALVKALESGKVKGAALDVLEYESVSFENLEKHHLPEPFRYLIASDKTVLSPHIAGWSYESHEKISKVLAQKIIRLFS